MGQGGSPAAKFLFLALFFSTAWTESFAGADLNQHKSVGQYCRFRLLLTDSVAELEMEEREIDSGVPAVFVI